MKRVTAAIITENGNVLITRRSPGESLAGYWEFPGGKIEKGETPHACLERELKEELGVVSRAGQVLIESEYHYDHGTFVIIGIITGITSGDISLTVHDNAVRVLVDRLLDYMLAPADVIISERVIEVSGNDHG